MALSWCYDIMLQGDKQTKIIMLFDRDIPSSTKTTSRITHYRASTKNHQQNQKGVDRETTIVCHYCELLVLSCSPKGKASLLEREGMIGIVLLYRSHLRLTRLVDSHRCGGPGRLCSAHGSVPIEVVVLPSAEELDALEELSPQEAHQDQGNHHPKGRPHSHTGVVLLVAMVALGLG